MLRKFMLLIVMLILMIGFVALPQRSTLAQTGPRITFFGTTVTTVSRDDLRAGTARIPVTWRSDGRPLWANLVFEQVLPNGKTQNIELPRPWAWVNSSGDGLVAPILPNNEATSITIQVRMVRFADPNFTYATSSFTLAIRDNVPQPPVISTFSTTATDVKRHELETGTSRVLVTWAVQNRPADSNLVFEQILADGTSVNVELPRSIAYVTSTGSGQVAPRMPSNDATQIRLVVRLIDTGDGRTYVTRELTVPIVTEAPPVCQFTNVLVSGSCPKTQQNIQLAYQPFERGFMVWRGDTKQIYVLFNNGTYEIFTDTWSSGEYLGETPPSGFYHPQRGFGKLWTDIPYVRSGLGWATAIETGYTTIVEGYDVWLQTFWSRDIYFRFPDNRLVRIMPSTGWTPPQWQFK